MRKKILVIQTAFIGDVILATGILEKLHHFFPDAQIDYLVRKGNESLFEDHPFLNEVLIWDKKQQKIRNLLKLIWKIRGKKYDTVITVQRYTSTGLLAGLSGAKERIGFDKNPMKALFTHVIKHEFGQGNHAPHEINRNNKLIEWFTNAVSYKPRLYPRQKDHEKLYRFKRTPYICIAPASVWFTKQYPVDKWLAMVEKVSYDYSIYLLGAPSDKALAHEIKRRTSNPYVLNMCGELSFLESCSLLEGAAMNFVNDSAPMHMASAVNAPVTAVYCSTVPDFGYGPLSDNSQIVQIDHKLYCRPCGLHGYQACPEGHFKCAMDIDTKRLLERIPLAVAAGGS